MGHAVQEDADDAPNALLTVPATHWMHVDADVAPRVALYLPAKHDVQPDAPIELYVPAGHCVH